MSRSNPIKQEYIACHKLRPELWAPSWKINVSQDCINVYLYPSYKLKKIYIRKGLSINIKQERLEVC